MDGTSGMIKYQPQQIDPAGKDAYMFRKEIICNEYNATDEFLTTLIPYNKNMEEEVWKFSKKKWESIDFDSMFGVFCNGELAAISGAKYYGPNKEYLRVGMMYYVLKRFRQEIRSTLWAPNGLIESALAFHKLSSPLDYSFISIYPHNSKLTALCNTMTRRKGYGQIGNGSVHIDLMKSYSVHSQKIMFNSVDQYIMYREERNHTSNIDVMIDVLDNKRKENS
jgi:hypothetical protein